MAIGTGSPQFTEPRSERPDSHDSTEAAQCLAAMSASAPIEINVTRPPRSKPARLSLACNPCRRRKVRCDARQPKCSNCTSRGDVCETFDLRRPGGPAGSRKQSTRRRADTTGTTATTQPEQPPRQPMERSSLRTEPQSQVPSGTPRRQSEAHAPTTVDSNEPRRARLGLSPQIVHQDAYADPGSVASSRARSTRSTRSQTQTHSKEQGPNITWLSRAYQEVSAAQVQSSVQEDGSNAGQQDAAAAAVTPDVVVNTDGSSNRLKVLGGTSLQCLFNFADLWLAGYGFDATAPLFAHGMSHSEEFQLSLSQTYPDLPQMPLLSKCVDAFFDRIWPIFPVVDRDALNGDIDGLMRLQSRDSQSLQTKLQPSWIPNLAIIYAVICLGMNEIDTSTSRQETSFDVRMGYLTACYGLHAHLTATPYQSSIQALILIALALRSTGGKDGQSWYITGQAVRMALSLGLHKTVGRSSVVGPDQQLQLDEHAIHLKKRLWWSCFSLERLMQLECGRSSSIDHSHDEVLVEKGFDVTEINNEQEAEGNGQFAYFSAWVSLAVVMGQISHRLYSQRFPNASEMLGETARLVQMLTVWEAGLPEHLRQEDSSYSIEARIAVLRTAIVFPDKSFKEEVQKRSLEVPDISRLYGGAASCVHAARSLVMQTLHLADVGVQSALTGVPPTFLACVVLALSILRAPMSRVARSDIELLTSATEYVESCYRDWGFPASFLTILSRLRDRTSAVFRGVAKPRGAIGTIENGTAGPRPETILHEATGPSQTQVGLPVPQGDFQNQIGPFHVEDLAFSGVNGFEAFTSLDFHDMWNMLDTDMFVYNIGE